MNKLDKGKLIRIELTEDNLDDYIGYFNLIKESMPNPDFLMNISKPYLIEMLRKNSHIYAYIYDGLIVSSAMILPCDKNAVRLSGLDLDYHEVLEYGPQFVHPDYRGNKLQYFMIDDLRYVALDLGFKYAIGVIDKDNEYSNANAEKYGKLIKTIEEDGRIQNVYFNDLLYGIET